MRTRDFDYTLPDDRIARTPVARGAARLLVLDAAGAERHRTVAELPALLRRGDLVVVNDTRVLPGPTRGGALRRAAGESSCSCSTATIHCGGARWRGRRRSSRPEPCCASATRSRPWSRRAARTASARCASRRRCPRCSNATAPCRCRRTSSAAPLPEDRDWYQTVYAAEPGAVAAPTAGLHLTREMLADARGGGRRGRRGHAPRRPRHLQAGQGRARRGSPPRRRALPAAGVDRARARADAGARRSGGGGRHHRGALSGGGGAGERRLDRRRAAGAGGSVRAGTGSTDLFIRPGFAFQVVDVLLTNFHLPRSTLLMLVAAFAGRERVLDAYREAIALGYRFYSYGDAMVAARRCDAP